MRAKDLNQDVPSARPVKKAKLSSDAAPSGMLLLMHGQLNAALSIKVPKAASREELRQALEAHPSILPLLELELESMEEEWLLALQEELTKPYFLAVSLEREHR